MRSLVPHGPPPAYSTTRTGTRRERCPSSTTISASSHNHHHQDGSVLDGNYTERQPYQVQDYAPRTSSPNARRSWTKYTYEQLPAQLPPPQPLHARKRKVRAQTDEGRGEYMDTIAAVRPTTKRTKQCDNHYDLRTHKDVDDFWTNVPYYHNEESQTFHNEPSNYYEVVPRRKGREGDHVLEEDHHNPRHHVHDDGSVGATKKHWQSFYDALTQQSDENDVEGGTNATTVSTTLGEEDSLNCVSDDFDTSTRILKDITPVPYYPLVDKHPQHQWDIGHGYVNDSN